MSLCANIHSHKLGAPEVTGCMKTLVKPKTDQVMNTEINSEKPVPQIGLRERPLRRKELEAASTPVPAPAPALAPANSLNEVATDALMAELFMRGNRIKGHLEEMSAANRKLQKQHTEYLGRVLETGEALDALAANVSDACKQIAASAKEDCKQIAASAKEDCKQIANTVLRESKTTIESTAATCLNRTQTLVAECSQRVETAETECRALTTTAVEECGKRAEAAEAEALRCIEQADKATVAANALGTSFNALNDRLHNIEISLRTIFATGAGFAAPAAPVYVAQPAAQPPPLPPPKLPPPKPPREDTIIKMQFVLFGLHQKEGEKIRQKLRYATARHSSLTIIENTLKEALPQHADYALVSGHPELGSRWKHCLDFYGPAKCFRLDNGSVAGFRQKIQNLYEARFPSAAAITPITAALQQASANNGR